MFNTLFTSLPILVVAAFDQDVNRKSMKDYPQLYQESIDKPSVSIYPFFRFSVFPTLSVFSQVGFTVVHRRYHSLCNYLLWCGVSIQSRLHSNWRTRNYVRIRRLKFPGFRSVGPGNRHLHRCNHNRQRKISPRSQVRCRYIFYEYSDAQNSSWNLWILASLVFSVVVWFLWLVMFNFVPPNANSILSDNVLYGVRILREYSIYNELIPSGTHVSIGKHDILVVCHPPAHVVSHSRFRLQIVSIYNSVDESLTSQPSPSLPTFQLADHWGDWEIWGWPTKETKEEQKGKEGEPHAAQKHQQLFKHRTIIHFTSYFIFNLQRAFFESLFHNIHLFYSELIYIS